MTQFWKAMALVMIGLILWLMTNEQKKDIATLLTLAVCCALAAVTGQYLEPVFEIIYQLAFSGQLEQELLGSLIRAVGVGLITEVAGMLCCDGGNTAMGGMVRFLGSAVILFLSIPVFQTLITLIHEILGAL